MLSSSNVNSHQLQAALANVGTLRSRNSTANSHGSSTASSASTRVSTAFSPSRFVGSSAHAPSSSKSSRRSTFPERPYIPNRALSDHYGTVCLPYARGIADQEVSLVQSESAPGTPLPSRRHLSIDRDFSATSAFRLRGGAGSATPTPQADTAQPSQHSSTHSSPYTPNPILGEPYRLSQAQSVAAAAAGAATASPSIPATVGAAEILPPLPATLGTSSENPQPQGKAKGKAKEKPAPWYSSLMDVDINPSNSTQAPLSPMAVDIRMRNLPPSDQPSSSRDGPEVPPRSSSPGSDEEPSVVHVTRFTTAPIPGDVVLRIPAEGQESLEEDAPGQYIPSKTQVNNRQVDGHEGDDEYEPNEDHEPYEDLHFTRNDMDQFHQRLDDTLQAGLDKIASAIANQRAAPAHPENAPLLQPVAGTLKNKGPKLTGNPDRRSFHDNEMAKSVRKHLTELVGKDRLLIPLVTNEQAAAFEALWNVDRGGTCNSCCSAHDFRFDILGAPRSPWNSSAARVFADHFTTFHGIPQTSTAIHDAMTCFFTRIKTLKDDYKRLSKGEHEQRIIARSSRRYQRKNTLFHRRFEAAQTHPLLQMHIHILQRLGVQGMSSDESDGKELVRNPSARLETPRFQVLRPWWRATELTTWLHIFDSVHMIERRSGDGGSRGAYPRLRVDNAQSPTYSNSQNFVRGLPINAYNQRWLAGRQDVPFSVRPVEGETYDFSHDPNVLDHVINLQMMGHRGAV